MLNIILIAYLVFINIIAFALYGIDKKHAVRHLNRIPESVLLWMARLGGGLGSWIGMFFFHHKKKHSRFRILIPLWIFIWMIAIAMFIALGNGNLSEELEVIRSKYNRF